MKTTIEISDALLAEARELARREGVTLRVLVERGLHQVVKAPAAAAPFELRLVTFKGDGLQPEFEDASWASLRDAAYAGRGG
jgi:hypothetical protein